MAKEKNDFIVHSLPVLEDNIIWIWVEGNQAVVVDPSISHPVKEWLTYKKFSLNAILQTHHHNDHIVGTLELLKEWPSAQVIASKKDFNRIPFQTCSVNHKDNLNLMGYSVQVIEVPGHTKHHISFFISDKSYKRNPILFPGDTLFGAGCGRLFEGSTTEMYHSLLKLKSLPNKTKVYSAHEYTLDNLRWANEQKPNDNLILSRINKVEIRRQNGLLSLPSSIEEEKKTNLFFKAKNIKEFSILRKNKDNWNG